MNVNDSFLFILHISTCFGLNYINIALTNRKRTDTTETFETSGIYFCTKKCKQSTSCASFNFHRGNLICELSGGGGDVDESEGWIHVDNPDKIQGNGFTLRQNNCGNSEKQYVLSSGIVKCMPVPMPATTTVTTTVTEPVTTTVTEPVTTTVTVPVTESPDDPEDQGYVCSTTCFKYYAADGRDYGDAFQVCADDGGSLAKIDSSARQSAIETYLEQINKNEVRIQGTRSNGVWKFDDGSAMSYFAWSTFLGEPGSDHFILVSKLLSWKWYTVSTSRQKNFVCEIPL